MIAPSRLMPPSAISGILRAHSQPAFDQRVKLRHAEVRVEARGAAAARADADFDAVDAALGKIGRAVCGRDVPGDQLEIAEPRAKRLERLGHHDRMTVRDVDDEHVDARLDQLGRALEIVPFRADCRADAKASLRVARRQRQPLLLDDVLGGDEAGQHATVVDERQLLDLAFDHHLLGLFERDRPGVHDELVERRHAVAHALLPGDEPHVARRQQPFQFARTVDDDQRADAGLLHHAAGVRQAVGRLDGVGIGDDAVLRALDDLDLAHLRRDVAAAEAAVDDAEARLLRPGRPPSPRA